MKLVAVVAATLGALTAACASSDETPRDEDGTSSGTTSSAVGAGGTSSSAATGGDASSSIGGGGAAGSAAGGGGQGGCTEPTTANWTCLPRDEGPLYGTGSAIVHVVVQETTQAMKIPGATVKVCALDDPACSTPLDEGVTDAIGEAAVDVPREVSVFLDVTADSYVPLLTFPWDPPPQNDNEVALLVMMTTPQQLATFAALAGTTPDPARGHLSVSAFDCSAANAPGVTVEVSTADANTVTGYWDSGVPKPNLPATVSGGAIIGNVPAGSATVHGTVLPLCNEPMGAAPVHVRAGTISVVELFPSPTR